MSLFSEHFLPPHGRLRHFRHNSNISLVVFVLQVFANPEDEKLLGDGKTHASKANVETVERVKR